MQYYCELFTLLVALLGNTEFCGNICILIKEITGCRIQCKPECILLNYWNTYPISSHLKQTKAILLVVAKLEIAAK